MRKLSRRLAVTAALAAAILPQITSAAEASGITTIPTAPNPPKADPAMDSLFRKLASAKYVDPTTRPSPPRRAMNVLTDRDNWQTFEWHIRHATYKPLRNPPVNRPFFPDYVTRSEFMTSHPGKIELRQLYSSGDYSFETRDPVSVDTTPAHTFEHPLEIRIDPAMRYGMYHTISWADRHSFAGTNGPYFGRRGVDVDIIWRNYPIDGGPMVGVTVTNTTGENLLVVQYEGSGYRLLGPGDKAQFFNLRGIVDFYHVSDGQRAGWVWWDRYPSWPLIG